jgi:hypothetical protein
MLKWNLRTHDDQLAIYVSTSYGTVMADLLTFDEDDLGTVRWNTEHPRTEYVRMQINVMDLLTKVVKEMCTRSGYLNRCRSRHYSDLSRVELYIITKEIGDYTEGKNEEE